MFWRALRASQNTRDEIYYSRDEIYGSTQSENRRNEAYLISSATNYLTRLFSECSSCNIMRPVFVFFILCTFLFSSINKEYHRRLGYHLSLGSRFRQKPQHLASIRFLRWKIWRFQPFLPLTYD